MLLAIDIGNSNIVIGGIENEVTIFEARIATDYVKTSDQYGADIRNILSLFRVDEAKIEDSIISSVVPPVFNAVRNGLMKLTGIEPMVVGPGMKTGLNILMESPSSVGSDLIVAAVAAMHDYPSPLILIDMGTATTITVLDKDSNFIGGSIIPGVRVSLEALSGRAAQLPGIQLDMPQKSIGKNTIDCMRSGIMFGAADTLDGMITRMEKEIGMPTTVVATGGMAPHIVPLCNREIHLERDLLLKGLNILYRKNKK